jgi:hypothetical protein
MGTLNMLGLAKRCKVGVRLQVCLGASAYRHTSRRHRNTLLIV